MTWEKGSERVLTLCTGKHTARKSRHGFASYMLRGGRLTTPLEAWGPSTRESRLRTENRIEGCRRGGHLMYSKAVKHNTLKVTKVKGKREPLHFVDRAFFSKSWKEKSAEKMVARILFDSPKQTQCSISFVDYEISALFRFPGSLKPEFEQPALFLFVQHDAMPRNKWKNIPRANTHVMTWARRDHDDHGHHCGENSVIILPPSSW